MKNNKVSIQSVRGMRDIFPPESCHYAALIALIEAVLHQYSYLPLELPLLEKTSLFARTIGAETDIVSKEMYTFNDRNDESLTLRPEATAGVVRALIENGYAQQQQRFYTKGAMFRYERPQKGRYRQFSQFSVEAFGVASALMDVELIALAAAIYRRLGVLSNLRLEINSIGLLAERKEFSRELVVFLKDNITHLDDDSRRRLDKNPLRILDSKNESVRAILQQAPSLFDYLGETSKRHFQQVCAALEKLGINYQINNNLVRGLDYYNHTVFEWVSDALGAQATVCAGGRYDDLVAQLGGKDTAAVGFALGLERTLMLALQAEALTIAAPWIYVIAATEELQILAIDIAEKLRQHYQNEMIFWHPTAQSLKAQMKKADKSGAKWALIIADDEVKENKVSIKELATGTQFLIAQHELLNFFTAKGR